MIKHDYAIEYHTRTLFGCGNPIKPRCSLEHPPWIPDCTIFKYCVWHGISNPVISIMQWSADAQVKAWPWLGPLRVRVPRVNQAPLGSAAQQSL